jgi:threonine dehydrogenase-like Zn-dependent dehydrogenase
MASIAFTANEYRADGEVRPARYAFTGSEVDGWEIQRDGVGHVRLGPGYRLLRVSHCGVCATDLARRDLPFPLPQILGHEVVATDDGGRAVVVEINASHAARRIATDCAYCARGLASHCPERLVLGIHDLPGGFGEWCLAPVDAVIPLPAGIDAPSATFVEPFAAALHAVRVVTRVPRRRIAVLGPRRLGMLVVAALAAWRRRVGAQYEIVALARRAGLRDLARGLGADDARDPAALGPGESDVVVETTGSPDGLRVAATLARDEVHLKTTCGRPGFGLTHATAFVVDELTLARDDMPMGPPVGGPPYETAAVLEHAPPSARAALAARGLRVVDDPLDVVHATAFGAVDVAVAGHLGEIDEAIRGSSGPRVRPRGLVLLARDAPPEALAAAIVGRGLVVTSSRCGDFRAALELLPDVPDLAARLVTATVPAERLADAFAQAEDPRHVKVVVTQPDGLF